ncbi:MFS transporter [Rhodococcus sp. SC4]|nr:MFS transporter [Rhodococcus sp. SC4]
MKTSEQIVQELPWRWSVQGRIVILGWLGYMFDAWDVALNGYLTPLLGTQFDLSTEQRGWVASANLIGMAVGAVVWGTIADRVGRKKSFTLTLLIFALFSLLGALSPTYTVFLLLRFVAGFGLGGCIPVDYAMVSEFSPSKQRGRVLATMGLWWPVGATLAGLTATLLLPVEGNWRWMLSLMVLPALLLFWVRRAVPESPLYLARSGRETEARQVIDDLVARTGAKVESYVFAPRPRVRREARRLRAAAQQLKLVWAFNPKVTSVAWLLTISILMVYYAALSWMPSILRAEGYGEQAAFGGTTVMTFVGIFGVLVSIAFVDVVGRKRIIGISAPLAAVALVAFAVLLSHGGPSVLLLAVFGFLIQVTIPVLYTFVSELYPTDLRASGFGWASSAGRVATGLSPALFGTLMWPLLGLSMTFAVLAVFLALTVIWMFVAVPETKGKELDHITEDRTELSVAPLDAIGKPTTHLPRT